MKLALLTARMCAAKKPRTFQARTIKGMMGANRWNRQRTLPAAGKERKKQE